MAVVPPDITAPPVTTPPEELHVVNAPAPERIAIGTDAFARYVPATTLPIVNRPFSAVCAPAGGPGVNAPLRGSRISMTIAPLTGCPSSSTTTPDTRNAGATCSVNEMLQTSAPRATVIGCAAARSAVPG